MFAIKKANGLFNPSRFETVEQAKAVFNPSAFGDVEIVKVARLKADHETKADFGADPFNQCLRVAQIQANRG